MQKERAPGAASAVHVLLAEDEAAIREGLVVLLEGEGFSVEAVGDGEAARDRFRARRPDLVLLDVMMPGMNGYRVCTEIRKADAEVPVVFLTAKDGEAEELRGLACGADDYVPKTASHQVLLARIASVLRRAGARRGDCPPAGDFDFAGWRVDAARLRLVSASGPGPELTLREIELMRLLARHPNELLSRDYLFNRFWGVDFCGSETTLSAALIRLRRKLGAGSACIEGVYGRGYRYVPPRGRP